MLNAVTGLVPNGGILIFLTKFGSHLYGTNTEQSDTDYKGIYVPSYKDMLLGTVKKTVRSDSDKAHGQKNTKDDVDVELMSIQKYMHELRAGETMALDMLHSNAQNTLYSHPTMDRLLSVKTQFYTRNLKAFVSYARKQAAKYGLKGSRLDAIQECMEVCTFGGDRKLSAVWDRLKVGEHSAFIGPNANGIQQYEICGKTLQESMRCVYAYSILSNYYNNYGARAILAQSNEGVDWKAISHAFRAGYQVKSILENNELTFPLKQADFLTAVKQGVFAYRDLAPQLEDLIAEIDELSASSALRDSVSLEYCNNLVLLMVTDVNGTTL